MRGGPEGHHQAQRAAGDPEAARGAPARLRDREPEKRWQAHYDLMLAQTVAFQVKAYEYRALMASIVNEPADAQGPAPRRPDDHLGRRSRQGAPGPPATRPPRSTPRPSGCSRRSSPSTPRPPGPTWRRTPSTAASRSSSTSGTTTRSTTTAPSSCRSIERPSHEAAPGSRGASTTDLDLASRSSTTAQFQDVRAVRDVARPEAERLIEPGRSRLFAPEAKPVEVASGRRDGLLDEPAAIPA